MNSKEGSFIKAFLTLLVLWLLIQVGSILFAVLDLNVAFQRTLVIVLVILFPLWLECEWFYDITAAGLLKNVCPKS